MGTHGHAIYTHAYAHIFRLMGGLTTTGAIVEFRKNGSPKIIRDGGADVYINSFKTWNCIPATDSDSSVFVISLATTRGDITEVTSNARGTGKRIPNRCTANSTVAIHKDKSSFLGHIDAGSYFDFIIKVHTQGGSNIFNSSPQGAGIVHLIFEHREKPEGFQRINTGAISNTNVRYKNINIELNNTDIKSDGTFKTELLDKYITGSIADVYFDFFTTVNSTLPTASGTAFYYFHIDQIDNPGQVANAEFPEAHRIANTATTTGAHTHVSGKWSHLGHMDSGALNSPEISGYVKFLSGSTILAGTGTVQFNLLLKFRDIS